MGGNKFNCCFRGSTKLDDYNLHFNVLIPVFEMIGDYTIAGKIMVLPITGSGYSNLTLGDFFLNPNIPKNLLNFFFGFSWNGGKGWHNRKTVWEKGRKIFRSDRIQPRHPAKAGLHAVRQSVQRWCRPRQSHEQFHERKLERHLQGTEIINRGHVRCHFQGNLQ